MIDGLIDTLSFSKLDLEMFAGLFARISAAVFLLPAFGEQAVPARVKLVAALCLTSLFISSIPNLEAYRTIGTSFPLLLYVEAINGLIIGFFLRSLEWGIYYVADAFLMGFSLATPFVAVSLIYNLGIGFINKAMPQLMVAMVGAPAASFLGLTMLAISSPVILAFWENTISLNLLMPNCSSLHS